EEDHDRNPVNAQYRADGYKQEPLDPDGDAELVIGDGKAPQGRNGDDDDHHGGNEAGGHRRLAENNGAHDAQGLADERGNTDAALPDELKGALQDEKLDD